MKPNHRMIKELITTSCGKTLLTSSLIKRHIWPDWLPSHMLFGEPLDRRMDRAIDFISSDVEICRLFMF